MSKLIETRLQRFILLLGGILMSIRLYDVGYRERYEAMFEAIGIAVLTFVLLAILRGYQPKFHIRIRSFIKKYRSIFILVLVLILLILGVRAYQAWQVKRAEAEAASAYQNCLDKVASTPRPVGQHAEYFSKWIDAGRPYYAMGAGYWELGFMRWMMENHSDFCTEYNPNLIKHHVEQREQMRELSNNPSQNYDNFEDFLKSKGY